MRRLIDPRALGALLSLTTVAASAGAQNLLTNFGLGHDVIEIDGHAGA